MNPALQKIGILCVDDEADNLDALERLLRSKYQVWKASSGSQALEILSDVAAHETTHRPTTPTHGTTEPISTPPIAVILTDQRMPQMTGVDLLTRTLEPFPDLIRILLTGYTDIESIISAVNSGHVYQYLTKPWDPVDLVTAVDRAVEKYKIQQELKEKNRALAQALGELKVLDQAKTNFMVLISHELRTPLTSIMNFSDLLRETHPTEEQQLGIQRISEGADRLKKIVDDVWTILSAELKTSKIQIQPFEGGDLQWDSLISKEILKLRETKQLTLHCHWPEKKRIIGDQVLIEKVLSNLISNAIKYALPGTEIRVVGEPLSHTSHRLRVSVLNLGPHIPETIMGRILRPFFIDEDIMNHSGGLGLGLTLCQSLLKAHGTSLHIENTKIKTTDTENEGSPGVRASFELPTL